MHSVTLIPGDGIGPEITGAVKTVIDAAGVDIHWDEQQVGQNALEKYGSPLPEHVIESIKANKVALKGPVTTHVGKGFKSINVT